MCDGCNFGNHPSQIYHIRSFSNPDGCMIPSAWLKKEEEGDRAVTVSPIFHNLFNIRKEERDSVKV
jgi:hypothetical protein